MSEKFSITIDGKECVCEQGEYIYDIAKRNGIFIPVLCRFDAFDDHTACCRVCIVEVIDSRGRSKVVASCVYPVDGPCEVLTNSEKIREERSIITMLLTQRAPEATNLADLCDSDAPEGFDLASLISIDGEKCVLCGLCVQACNAMGSGAISTILRGTDKRVATPYDEESLDCLGCLSCANVCPTNAIEYSSSDETISIWHRDFEVAHCECCGAVIGSVETLKRASSVAGTEVQTLCESCRRVSVAKQMEGAWPYK